MTIDAGLVISGIAVLLVIIGMMAGLVWLVVGITVSPMKDDLKFIKENFSTPGDLRRMMQVEIAKHERECRQDRLTETGIAKAR